MGTDGVSSEIFIGQQMASFTQWSSDQLTSKGRSTGYKFMLLGSKLKPLQKGHKTIQKLESLGEKESITKSTPYAIIPNMYRLIKEAQEPLQINFKIKMHICEDDAKQVKIDKRVICNEFFLLDDRQNAMH